MLDKFKIQDSERLEALSLQASPTTAKFERCLWKSLQTSRLAELLVVRHKLGLYIYIYIEYII